MPRITENCRKLLDITTTFSNDICMKFGLDRCKTLNIKEGENTQSEQYLVNDDETIEPMEPTDVYKYLGYQQSKAIQEKPIKRQSVKP